MRSSAVCARNPRHAVRPVMMTVMVSYVLFFCKEIHRALRRIKLPERRHSPSRSEYVVVKALAVATVVPCGMLHHFGIETLHADAAETLLYRQELVERCVDDVVYLSETRFAELLAQSFHDVRQLEYEHVDVVVLHRHVAPAAALETEVAQHLPFGERHIPQIVPRKGEV